MRQNKTLFIRNLLVSGQYNELIKIHDDEKNEVVCKNRVELSLLLTT